MQLFHLYRNNPASRYIRARSPILDVASPHSCQQASACLEECILHHRDCPKPQLAQLPTRVIDCTDPGHPKLLITGSMRCSYAALSYVWGEKQPHCTTQKNLDTYLTSGINRNLLPKTIRDAIDSTHRFNIRYLWVDALCILQDSREDKDREIHQMRRIYEQAHVTLIAASAHMVSEGFLHDRPRVPPYSRLPFICPDNGQIGAMALSPVWKQYDDKQEPVNTRAWCLEERLLSSRAFIYASHTLQYHCQTHTINIGNNIHNPQDGRRLPRLVFSPTTPLPLSKEDLSRARVTWHDIVDNYTSRHVTKERDKLLALAGVVEKFHRVMGSGYIGGLWRSTLLRDLLWMKDYNAYAPRPGKYRAPSWSWAAVDGRVVYGDFDSRLDPDRSNIMQCHVLEYEVSLVNRDLPFGRICGGVLKVRSPLKRVTWNASAPLPKLYECAVQDEEGSPNHHQVDVVQKGELCCLGDALPDSLDEVLSPPGETWALPLLWNVEEAYVVGLVVAAASEHYFRRVGYFSSDDSMKDIAWIQQSAVREIALL
ncbi:heterokaryon incompatibility domain-containing protein [Trichoderma austrokoningii]